MILKATLGIIIGAAIGFGVGHFGRCVSGTCMLTKNPFVLTIIGAILGLLIAVSK